MELDLQADLNAEDDEGFNWGLVRNAANPGLLRRGAVLRAGSAASWSWIVVVRVDPDGQVHFRQISASEAKRKLSARRSVEA